MRLNDNAALAEAARSGDVIPVHLIETRILDRAERNPRRAAFYCGAVSSLAADLAARGTTLVVRNDGSAAAIARLAAQTRASTVTWATAYDAATVEAQHALRRALEGYGLDVRIVHDAPAVAPDETAAARSDGARGYRALAPFVAAWSTKTRAPIENTTRFAEPGAVRSDALPSIPTRARVRNSDGSREGVGAEISSERAALGALDTYLAGLALQYPTARDVPAGPPTARVSAALSFGVLAARTILARIDERARDPFLLTEERLALVAFARAMAHRDFFLQLAWFYEDAPDRALQARMDGFTFATEHPALDAWRVGRTGYPLVDAGMRQLRATGWMHPRARLVAASFLCFDLGIDWRVGRDAWDDDLVEDDAALANGNWQWIAGVGADLAQFPRIYNPYKQARAYDPLGAYVRRYVTELSRAPESEFVRAAAGARQQMRLELFGESRYPTPVVEHESAARAYLARYAEWTRASRATP